MKSLLRLSLLALLLCGTIAGFASSSVSSHAPQLPVPPPTVN